LKSLYFSTPFMSMTANMNHDNDDTGSDAANTWSTLDMITLPAKEAGEFYRQLNLEIENLRGKVDTQLKQMIRANEKDITGLDRQLRELKGETNITRGRSSVRSPDLDIVSSHSSIRPLQVTTSTLTEQATNLSKYKYARRIESPPVQEIEYDDSPTRSEQLRQHERDDIFVPIGTSIGSFVEENLHEDDLSDDEYDEAVSDPPPTVNNYRFTNKPNESNVDDEDEEDDTDDEDDDDSEDEEDVDAILSARNAKDIDSEYNSIQSAGKIVSRSGSQSRTSNGKQRHSRSFFPESDDEGSHQLVNSRVSRSSNEDSDDDEESALEYNGLDDDKPNNDPPIETRRAVIPTRIQSDPSSEFRDAPQHGTVRDRPDAPIIKGLSIIQQQAIVKKPDAPSQRSSVKSVAGLVVVDGMDLSAQSSIKPDPSTDQSSVAASERTPMSRSSKGKPKKVIKTKKSDATSASSITSNTSIPPTIPVASTISVVPARSVASVVPSASIVSIVPGASAASVAPIASAVPAKPVASLAPSHSNVKVAQECNGIKAGETEKEEFTSADLYDGEIIRIEQVRNKHMTDPYGDKGKYTGILIRDRPHGHGTMSYSDGRSYAGNWKYGRWHGSGRARFANGDCYVGQYNMDQRHGVGRYEWSDGRVYDGEFCRDQRHGAGTYTWTDGSVYTGEFSNGHRHGHGCYMFSNGSIYTGEWCQGKYHGVGECVWADGRMYRGEWYNGRAHGYGKSPL
jgi:hypothetical protein